MKNINFNSQLDDLWKYIKVKTYCWLLSPLLPTRTGAKPHLKRGAWAVSLGSEMRAFNLVVSPWNEAAANEPARTKVSSKWVSKKSKQARWQIANKRTSSSGDEDSVHGRTSGCQELLSLGSLFLRLLQHAGALFKGSPLTLPATFWPGLNVGLPGCLFGFCFVCLVSMPAWYLFLFSSVI